MTDELRKLSNEMNLLTVEVACKVRCKAGEGGGIGGGR